MFVRFHVFVFQLQLAFHVSLHSFQLCSIVVGQAGNLRSGHACFLNKGKHGYPQSQVSRETWPHFLQTPM